MYLEHTSHHSQLAKVGGRNGFDARMHFMTDTIDWKELRKKIAETPVIVPPKHVKHLNRSPESLEKRRISARARWKKHYWSNREKCLELQREWEKTNPEKVKAKRKRFYEKHKNDPEWMEHHRQKNREYKARKRMEKSCYNAA